jgi:hypothetical protein
VPAVNEIEENCRLDVTRRLFSVTNGLLREAVEDVDELGQPEALLGFSLGNPIGHAGLDVVSEHRKADAIERGLGGGKLLQDVQTEARLLDHAADAADLPFDAVEAGDEALLLRWV